MSSVRAKTWHQDLETIFGGGGLSTQSDGQLLEKFLGGRDETGEQAFGALVERHGPMVLRVCGQVLGDCHEAQDAFQAVFLVLARKAAMVRNRESVGSWLYGVALRVSARARAGLNRRRTRERQAEDGVENISSQTAQVPGDSNNDVEAVHQEVGRLSEKYRAPIILCYMEGLTHDQAAARLRWPVGTVRSRLARARDQLRGRLIRRGVTVPAVLGPLAGWLGFEAAATAEAATIAATSLSAVPAGLLIMTIRSACQFADGKAATVALFSAASFTLTRGVLKTMALEKLIVIAGSLLPAGALVVAAGAMIGQSSDPKNGPVAPAVVNQEAKKADPADPKSTVTGRDPAEQERLREAEARLKEVELNFQSEWKRYRERETGVDTLLPVADHLYLEERNADRGSLVELAQRHLNRLKEIEAFEQEEIKAGRGKQPGLEAVQREVAAAKMETKSGREFK